MNRIGTRWVYKIKYKGDEEVKKARLVAKGYKQQIGIAFLIHFLLLLSLPLSQLFLPKLL